MIEISNVEIFGWEAAIRGMRNPKNSWDKSDSKSVEENCENCMYKVDYSVCKHNPIHKCFKFDVGPNDLKLMKTLANAGDDHGKFLRMINVTLDINAPLYWWKEFDTYKVGTVANSCSTMHKIHAKEFVMDDFSYEHNIYWGNLSHTIDALNHAREQYLLTKDKKYWYSMIQTLPTSYNQKRTIQLNYAVLKNMYHSRRFHKLDEWRDFCDFIRTLPYSELITGEEPQSDV